MIEQGDEQDQKYAIRWDFARQKTVPLYPASAGRTELTVQESIDIIDSIDSIDSMVSTDSTDSIDSTDRTATKPQP